jgi:hypothetical protein
MQTLTRINVVLIKYYYHMTTIDENVNRMELAHLYQIFFQPLRAPLCTSTFTLTFLIAFLKVHTREKIIYLPYVYYVC